MNTSFKSFALGGSSQHPAHWKPYRLKEYWNALPVMLAAIGETFALRMPPKIIYLHVRVFGFYQFTQSLSLPNSENFWIITEADRSSTCVLLPSNY